jgi:hypothetical protein
MATKKQATDPPKHGAASEATQPSEAQSPHSPDSAPGAADSTVPGGRYVVDGVVVNCDGEPIE